MVVRREPPEDELADLGRRLAENLPGGEGYAQTMRDEARRTADELRANPSQIPAALASTCDLELNARDVYGDGDQSPLEDSLDASNPRNAQRLRDVWCTGGDLNQLLATGRVTAFFRYCFAGDARLVGDFIAAARADPDPDALRNLLERRESQMHVSPLFAVVAGARMRVIFDDQVVDHVECARLLVSAGANVNARDVAGYTPIAMCTNGVKANDDDGDDSLREALKIAILLGEAGADARLANRFAEPPLIACVLAGVFIPWMTILLEFGADPKQESTGNGNVSAYGMVFGSGPMPMKTARALLSADVYKEGGVVGRDVRVHGLTSASAKALNGKVGTVRRLDPVTGKYEVSLHGEEDRIISIAPWKLKLAEEMFGCVVRLKDLTGRSELNGRRGICGTYLRHRGRYEIAVQATNDAPAEKISVKPCNIERLERLSKIGNCAGCGVAASSDEKKPKGSKKKGERAKESAKDDARVKLRYCGRCYTVVYCGDECVKANWNLHKEECAARCANQARINLQRIKESTPRGMSFSTVNMQTHQIDALNEFGEIVASKNESFTVKVQIPLVPPGMGRTLQNGMGAMVYDEKRRLQFHIPANPPFEKEYQQAVEHVESKGLTAMGSAKGVKAYFPARLIDSGKTILIDFHEALTPPAW